jgi:hypothetical protein
MRAHTHGASRLCYVTVVPLSGKVFAFSNSWQSLGSYPALFPSLSKSSRSLGSISIAPIYSQELWGPPTKKTPGKEETRRPHWAGDSCGESIRFAARLRTRNPPGRKTNPVCAALSLRRTLRRVTGPERYRLRSNSLRSCTALTSITFIPSQLGMVEVRKASLLGRRLARFLKERPRKYRTWQETGPSRNNPEHNGANRLLAGSEPT